MPPHPSIDHARRLLGVTRSATAQDVADARRRLAKRFHPDAGGSEREMQQVNDAAAIVLASIGEPADRSRRRSSSGPPDDRRRPAPASSRPAPRRARSDHPSFTIDLLPVDAFAGLVEAGERLGSVVDDDPPYELDVVVDPPLRCWCRLALVPDAGSSTVSLTVAPLDGATPPELDDVRDVWIAALNELDWDRIAPPRPS